MTPPFQPGDRVTVRYNKPLGALEVQYVDQNIEGNGWYCECRGKTPEGRSVRYLGPATSLIKVEDNATQ